MRTKQQAASSKHAAFSYKYGCILKIKKYNDELIPFPPARLQVNLNKQELANSEGRVEEEGDSSSKRVVVSLYEALNCGDADTVVKIVASDLEWWFHGPPSHQFLMRMLTGQPEASPFGFIPQSITCLGPTVLVEGCDNSRSISWVHALTLSHGIITQIREYFNTSLTVTRFAHSDDDSLRCPCLWESSVSDRVGKSVPGLVLAL